MKIAVVGAGALGLYYGALLQRGGAEVHFLLRRDYGAVRERGLAVRSAEGDLSLPPVAAHRLPEEIGPVDLLLIGLKTVANDRFSDLIPPLLGPATLILDLQNGLGNEERLAELFGPELVIGGVAYLCSTRGEPGTVHHLGAGRVVIGEFSRLDPSRTTRIAAAFASGGIDCRIVDDLTRALWEKLAWNIPFDGLSALLMQLRMVS